MSFVTGLNQRYFDGGLSQATLDLLAPIDNERPDVRRLVERMCRQFQRAKLPATDFSEALAWITGFFLPKILPGAWGGSVPPITQKGRHSAIDDYLARNPWRPLRDGDRLLDLGCGFPPVTTLDTAERFPQVSIKGADPALGKYLVRDANGDYAVFDDGFGLIYFQAGAVDIVRWQALYDDPRATAERFLSELKALLPGMPADDGRLGRIAGDGFELVRNPAAEFERQNVSLEKVGFGTPGFSGFSAARCFNVLYYFDENFREEALAWLGDVLVDGGIFVSGGNWSRSRYARYSVHQNQQGTLVPREFAFSIENLRPLELVAVFALHDVDHDLDLLTTLIGILRSDTSFCRDVDRRMDEIQDEIGFCPRNADGYLASIREGTDPAILNSAADVIGSALEREGFPERAVAILEREGYRAWINCVGHVAIDPARL
jgi:hypothetical protein